MRALVEDLAAVLEYPVPRGLTVVWHDDGPHIGVRADTLRTLLDAHPTWPAVTARRYRDTTDGVTPAEPAPPPGPPDPALLGPFPTGAGTTAMSGEERARVANALRDRYDQHPELSIADLAADLPFAYHVVRQLLKDAGTTIRRSPISVRAAAEAPRRRQELIQMGLALRHFYLLGRSQQVLTQLAERSTTTVVRALHAVGVYEKGKSRFTEPGRRITPEELRALGQLIGPRYMAGASMNALAEMTGQKSIGLIRSALVAAGHPIRRSRVF